MATKQDRRVIEEESKKPLPDLEQVKPASNLAEAKAAAAMVALRSSAGNGFQDLSSFWIGNLLQHGLVFKEVLSDRIVLSLSFCGHAGISWELTPVHNGEDQYLALSNPNMDTSAACGRLQFFIVATACTVASDGFEEYMGIPTVICFLPLFQHMFQYFWLG